MHAKPITTEDKQLSHFRFENTKLVVQLLTDLEVPGLDTLLQVLDRFDAQLHNVLGLKDAVLLRHEILDVEQLFERVTEVISAGLLLAARMRELVYLLRWLEVLLVLRDGRGLLIVEIVQ